MYYEIIKYSSCILDLYTFYSNITIIVKHLQTICSGEISCCILILYTFNSNFIIIVNNLYKLYSCYISRILFSYTYFFVTCKIIINNNLLSDMLLGTLKKMFLPLS